MSFDRWRARLAGEKVVTYLQPDPEDEGYYRKPITEPKLNAQGERNGQKRIVGWEPVAYFIDRGRLCGVIGDRDMAINEVTDESLWSWVVRHPISEELYRAAERGEPWPDLDLKMAGANGHAIPADAVVSDDGALGMIPAANRDVAKSDNKPPEELPPEVEHAQAIDNAIGAAKDLPVTTVAEAALAAGAANIIRDRRLAAEKVAKGKVDPLHRAYVDEREKWVPVVTRAKTAEEVIRLKVRNFEADERKRVAKEQLDALEKQRLIDEANQQAADRAIAAGKPEPAPVVKDVVIPQAPPPVTPTYGSYKPRAKPILKFAVIENAEAVLRHFVLRTEVIELIQKLATNDIRNGLEVPGATFREGTE